MRWLATVLRWVLSLILQLYSPTSNISKVDGYGYRQASSASTEFFWLLTDHQYNFCRTRSRSLLSYVAHQWSLAAEESNKSNILVVDTSKTNDLQSSSLMDSMSSLLDSKFLSDCSITVYKLRKLSLNHNPSTLLYFKVHFYPLYIL